MTLILILKLLVRFVLGLVIGCLVVGVSSAIYMLCSIRRIELFPALAGAVAVPAVLVLVAFQCVWAIRRRKRQAVVQTITVEMPVLDRVWNR
jgi:hypothetical protein